MPVKRMPGMVACTGAVVVASESSNPEAQLTLTLRTEGGEQYLLSLSEQTARQLQRFNRTRDTLFERPSAATQ
jgi:hypothetical protein